MAFGISPDARADPNEHTPTYRMPTVDVEGDRLTLAELIELAARRVDESSELDIPHRYTRHVRVVMMGASGEPQRRKKTVVESVSRIETGPGRSRRDIRIWDRVETFRGDSLVKVETDRKAAEAYDAQFEGYRNLPFAVRGGLFEYEILDRRPIGDRALLRIAYKPAVRFSSLPSGEAWLDTRDFVVLRQTGSITNNVPMPMFIHQIEAFRLGRTRYGPLWLEDDFYLKVRLRMTALGLPETVEMRIRFHDVEFPDLPAPVLRLMNLRNMGDQEVQAVLDSLQSAEDARIASEMLQPAAEDLSLASAAGDSLLGAWSGPPAIRYLGVRPVAHYNRVDRLAAGAGVAFSGGSINPSLAIEGGYSFGRERGFGQAGVSLARRTGGSAGSGGRRSAPALISGVKAEVRDQSDTFGAGRLPAQGLLTVVDGLDPSDYYGAREATVTLFAGRPPDPSRRAEGVFQRGFRVGPMLGSSIFLTARGAEYSLLPPRSIWTVAHGQVPGDPILQADPGPLRAAGAGITWEYRRLFNRIQSRLYTETAGHGLGGDFEYSVSRGDAAVRLLLPGGRRLAVRGQFQGSSAGLPRQENLFLGGITTLRAYSAGTIEGRSGAHLGAELHLNRDIVGWLPGVPARGLGLEAHISGDIGYIRRAWRDHTDADGSADGSPGNAAAFIHRDDEVRACLGVGCSRILGLPGLTRVGIGAHFAVGRGDREWAVRLYAE